MVSGTNHSSLDRHILQNDDKNDKTHSYMLSLPDSPGDSRNLVRSPDLPIGRMNLPDFYHYQSSSSSLGSRCVPWLGEGLSMLSPNYPVLCFPLPYRVAPVFVQVVSPSLGWSPLSSFLVIWSPTGDTRGPSVVFEAVDMPCPGPFHFSYSVDYIYDFCPLPDPG